MIDLHSHLLPGLDDGAIDLAMSLEMARMAVADGVTIMACTPHIFPGVYNNVGPNIEQWVEWLQSELHAAQIPLWLVSGADVHLAPGLVDKVRSGEVLSLHGSRYILIEPPHHILPPRAEDVFFELLSAGFIPILTHPERMGWIERNYGLIERLVRSGVWMQLTAAAVIGEFGREAAAWSLRMISDGFCHIVASDAHHPTKRPPRMRAAREYLVELVGEEEADNLVLRRPELIIYDKDPDSVALPVARRQAPQEDEAPNRSFWQSVSGYFTGR